MVSVDTSFWGNDSHIVCLHLVLPHSFHIPPVVAQRFAHGLLTSPARRKPSSAASPHSLATPSDIYARVACKSLCLKVEQGARNIPESPFPVPVAECLREGQSACAWVRVHSRISPLGGWGGVSITCSCVRGRIGASGPPTKNNHPKTFVLGLNNITNGANHETINERITKSDHVPSTTTTDITLNDMLNGQLTEP